MIETPHTPTNDEIEQLFKADNVPMNPDVKKFLDNVEQNIDRHIPNFLRPTEDPTVELLVDSQLPVITLIRAMAAYGLTIRPYKNQLVLTHRPERFV